MMSELLAVLDSDTNRGGSWTWKTGFKPRLSAKMRCALGLVVWLAGSPTLRAESAGTKWNVILVLADDLGWSDLACYGGDLHETPNLDRLARTGMRFTDAYSASVCSPTRACLMTGKHYARLHMTIWFEASQKPPQNRPLIPPVTERNLPHNEVTLADVFQSAGYSTAAVGKWHLGEATHYPETQGFDANIGGTLWGAPQSYFFPYRGSARFGGEFRYVPHLEGGQAGEYLTDRLSDEAVAFIDQANNRPFFLYLAHHAPHTPIEGKPQLVAHYAEKIRPGMRQQNAAYAAMVHSLDESVGRVWEAVERQGLADRTVLIFLSDNGGYVNQFDKRQVTDNSPLRSGKGSLYEGGIRVPLIIRWPGITRGSAVCREPVFAADLYPTLLDITGLKGDPAHNADVDGMSLVPLLQEAGRKLAREAVYFHYPHYYATTTPVSAVRSRDWKLIEFLEDERLELFDLGEDLGETNNLAKVEMAKAAELRTLLHSWRSDVNAQMPAVNPQYKKKE